MSTTQQVKPYRFENSSDNSVTVYLHGYIGSGDSINAASFMQEFDEATQGVENVTFNINSGGGSVIEGFAIVDLVRQRKKKITSEVYGMAGSMGFVLMLLGQKIRISRNSNILTHRVSGMAWGDADAMKAASEKAAQFEAVIIDMTVERTKLPKETVMTWFQSGKDKWFNAAEALANNIVDEIIDSKDETLTIQNNTPPMEVYNKFYNQVKPAIKMSKHFYAKLGIQEGDEAKALQELDTLLAYKAKVAVLESQIAEAQKEKAKNLVNSAVASGKVTEANRTVYDNLAEKDYASAEAIINSIPVPVAPATPAAPVVPGVSIAQAIQNAATNTPTQGRENWSYIDWAKNDPTGLANMTNEQRETLKLKK
jgi:ATP-dependent protease ClpP protease subunit